MKKVLKEVHEGTALPVDTSLAPKEGTDPLAIDAIDYIEFFVDNAKLTAHYFCSVFGFSPLAYRGPETNYPSAASHVVRQGNVTLVFTAPLRPTHQAATAVLFHGMTANDVALKVPDCQNFFYEALKRGASAASHPTSWSDEFGTVRRAAIKTYGKTIHSIVERRNYGGSFWPGFIPYGEISPSFLLNEGIGIQSIDHIVGNVELGAMNNWVHFYERILGFQEMRHFTADEISTEYSALMSKVVSDGSGKIKFPINEPAEGRRKSQIEEFLDFHMGPGVQHIALLTENIIETVSSLRTRGVQFLRVPTTYYDDIPERVGVIKEDIARLSELGILVDRDEEGYLLQIFTKPVTDRPTIFFEIIQREGAKGFGAGNFKALFEALEREQSLRGNL